MDTLDGVGRQSIVGEVEIPQASVHPQELTQGLAHLRSVLQLVVAEVDTGQRGVAMETVEQGAEGAPGHAVVA